MLALSLPLLGIEAASATDVRIYTDAAHPVAAPESASVIHLDAPASIKSELSRGLPKDPASAAEVARERLIVRGDTLTRRLSSSYQGAIEAWSLGIVKLPAIVVDGRYVVYGDSNVAHALSLIKRYRELKAQ